MWLMLASASPRKPYVAMELRSSNDCSLDVVKRSHRIGRSSFYQMVRRKKQSLRVPARAVSRSYLNATAVVRDLQQLEATVFDKHLKSCSAGIDSILHQFLQCVNGSNYNLTSCNFIDNILVQRLRCLG